MFRSVRHRISGFIIATVVGAFPVLGQPLPAAASATGTLFGIVIGQPNVSRIDPTTGSLTPLASLALPPTEPGPGFGSFMADDPNTHRLFLMRIRSAFVSPPVTTYELDTIDSQTGTLSTAPLAHPLASAAFETTTGTLFGVTSDCCPNQIVRVDPTTGAETALATLTGDDFSPIALAPASHALYVISESFATFPATSKLVTMDTESNVITPGPVLSAGTRGLVYDTSLGMLYGITFCCPAHFVRLDPVTGSMTQLGNYDFGFYLEPGLTIDSASHTVFAVQDVFDIFTGPVAHIASINDVTGAGALGGSTGGNIAGIGFEPVLITPESIEADVRQALASGAISPAGVAKSLLANLEPAAVARSRGECDEADRQYEAFVHELQAQSGKHVAAATATQLISEAQFLIANCT